MVVAGAAFALLKLTVVIYNSEAVPLPEMTRAEAVAGQIFRSAGVEIQWRPATGADLTLGATDLPLHLLSARPSGFAPDAGGYSMLMPEGSYAAVSWLAVSETAHVLRADEPTLLGAVIAHELGHVLLHSREHSASGIMVMRFRPHDVASAARGELLFQRSEIRRIHAEAARRATIPR